MLYVIYKVATVYCKSALYFFRAVLTVPAFCSTNVLSLMQSVQFIKYVSVVFIVYITCIVRVNSVFVGHEHYMRGGSNV